MASNELQTAIKEYNESLIALAEEAARLATAQAKAMAVIAESAKSLALFHSEFLFYTKQAKKREDQAHDSFLAPYPVVIRQIK